MIPIDRSSIPSYDALMTKMYYPVTDPALDAPDGAVMTFPNGHRYERIGDEWVIINPPEPRHPRRLVPTETFEGFPIEWAPNGPITASHAYVRGPGAGDGSICGRATYNHHDGYAAPRCSYCEARIEIVLR